MKLLVFSCAHFKHDAPAGRKDGYGGQILAKVKWIMDNAGQLDAFPVCLGDLFDKKSGTTLRETYDMMFTIRNSGRGTLYLLLGNHDIQGYNQDISTQPVGILIQSGCIKKVEDLNGKCSSVIVTAEHYRADYENAKSYASEPLNGFHIHMTHGMLVNRPCPWDATVVNDAFIAGINADLLLNGHNHVSFQCDKVLNVGSIARISRDGNYLNTFPKAFLVDTSDKSVKLVMVPCHDDVWIDKEEEREPVDFGSFEKAMNDAGEIKDKTAILDGLLKDEQASVKQRVVELMDYK